MQPGSHTDPITLVILGVTGVLFFAVLGRFLARQLDQPSVLGELLMGVALGNLGYLFGFEFIVVLREGAAVFEMMELALTGTSVVEAAHIALGEANARLILGILHGPYGAELLQVAHTVDIFSRYGVIFLLFMVGLESSIAEMRQVGGESMRVAIISVVLPFLLGFEAARLIMPELSLNSSLFIAATLGATSVGITARVLHDMQRETSREARIILGAAITDDVLGLLMLAVVSGVIVSGAMDIWNITRTIVLALLFLVGAVASGPYLLKLTITLFRHFDIVEAKMFVSFLYVMLLAWFATVVGLATIVGAFTAGLILHDAYFRHWGDHNEHRYSIRDLIMPLEVILVPLFFILMGVQVKIETFFD